jgi:hypothetical protein
MKFASKAVSLLLASALLTAAVVPAFADNADPVDETVLNAADPAVVPEETAPAYHTGFATVSEVNEDAVLVTTDDGQELQLNVGVSEEGRTAIVDNATGLPLNLSELTVGSQIYYYAQPMMTMSLPAQSPAKVILANVADSTPAHLLTVESFDDVAGGIRLSCGDKVVTVLEETPLSPLLTRNIIHYSELTVGTEVLAWYDMMTLSLPAQATADRVVVLSLPEEKEGARDEAAEDNGVAVPISETRRQAVTSDTKQVGNVTMVPVRAVAEALGYTVGWDNDTQSVRVTDDDGAPLVSFSVGEDSYLFGDAADPSAVVVDSTALEQAAFVVEPGVTYVPVALFEHLGAQLTEENGSITFTIE